MNASTNLFHLPTNSSRADLQQFLHDCIRSEHYEMAAQIRDKLRAIQHLEGKRVEVIVKPSDRNREICLLKREFPIKLSLCRQDLIHPQVGLSQYDALKLTNAEMQRISSKMADIFGDDLFFATLRTIVDSGLSHR